jgi:hypothetical protein
VISVSSDTMARPPTWRLASRWTALAAGGLLLAMIVTIVLIEARFAPRELSGSGDGLLFLAFGAVGVVIGWHQPRNRRAPAEHRQQLKWLTTGVAIFIAGAVLTVWLPNLTGYWKIFEYIGLAATFALPVSIAMGILKFRLYDIDRVISRTIAYALVTGLLVGTYAGLVLLATRVLPVSGPVAVAGSTLAVAALFNPLRRWVQRIVDRRFNRARYDADQMVTAFAARLQDATDLEGVRGDLLGTVRQALAPAHASVWLGGGQP